MKRVVLGLAIVVLAPSLCPAQRRPESSQRFALPPSVVRQDVRQPDDEVGPALGATIGAVGGMLALMMASRCDRERCAWSGVWNGMTLGWPVGAAVGAHVGNARRGSLAWDLAATLLSGALGHRLARYSHNDGMLHLYTMLTQIVVAAAVERSTGAGKAPRDTLTARQGPAR